MIKKINDFLAGVPMTIVSALSLVASLALKIAKIPVPVDPAWIAVIVSGLPLIYLAVWRIIHNPGISKISSALLISIAMVAAIFIGDLFAAGEVAFIMAIGAILEDKTTEHAEKGLKKLISLKPREASLLDGDNIVKINVKDLAVGNIIRILPGETVPADGVIVSGRSSVDESVMTGESLPVDKGEGDKVFCGTANRFGAMDVRVTHTDDDSSLEKMIKMVTDAAKEKAPIARIADVAASYLVPIALGIAIIGYFATGDIVRAVTILVVFCPCALVLATPTAVMAGIGQATKNGVVIRSGEALETMGKVDTVCFDKTGTLTLGKLSVSDIISLDEKMTEDELLALCAAAESFSEHPLAAAVVSDAEAKGLTLSAASDFTMDPGGGIQAVIGGSKIICGNAKYLDKQGIVIEEALTAKTEALSGEGKAIMMVARDDKPIGIIALADSLRPDAASVVERLKKQKVTPVLLTGDHRAAAGHIAKAVGIDEVRAECLPEDKVAAIKALQGEGHHVCMVGDGVNDAPALKTADIGVAMGGMGSDVAQDAAGAVLMGDDIDKLPYLKKLAVTTVGTIKFAIGLSLVINAIAIILSLLGMLTPTTGALWHNCGSCFVVLLAALLYDRKIEA